MLDRVGKAVIYAKSTVLALYIKARYGKRVDIKLWNSLRGKVSLWIDGNSKITWGDFLMLLGPIYMKAVHGGNIVIGNRCFFNRNCSITSVGTISIGEQCTFANNVVIVDHDHNIGSDKEEQPYTIKEIHIGNHVWIGANAVILKGVTIGDNAVIAAGAVVNRDVESGYIYGGVPAKKIKKI
nr:acyltransferase [uncultured Acetatifactor sp.]